MSDNLSWIVAVASYCNEAIGADIEAQTDEQKIKFPTQFAVFQNPIIEHNVQFKANC